MDQSQEMDRYRRAVAPSVLKDEAGIRWDVATVSRHEDNSKHLTRFREAIRAIGERMVGGLTEVEAWVLDDVVESVSGRLETDLVDYVGRVLQVRAEKRAEIGA